MNGVARFPIWPWRRTMSSMQCLALSVIALLAQDRFEATGPSAIADRGLPPPVAALAQERSGVAARMVANADVDVDAAGDHADDGTDCCGAVPVVPAQGAPILVHGERPGSGGRLAFFDCPTDLLLTGWPMAPGG